MQRRAREQADAARRAAEADEAYRASCLRATAVFAPLVQEKERARLAGQKPLVWQMDPIAAAAADKGSAARESARAMRRKILEATARAGAGRTPLFVDMGLGAAREAAALSALEQVDATLRRHGAGDSAEAVLSAEERELLGHTARARGGGNGGKAGKQQPKREASESKGSPRASDGENGGGDGGGGGGGGGSAGEGAPSWGEVASAALDAVAVASSAAE